MHLGQAISIQEAGVAPGVQTKPERSCQVMSGRISYMKPLTVEHPGYADTEKPRQKPSTHRQDGKAMEIW